MTLNPLRELKKVEFLCLYGESIRDIGPVAEMEGLESLMIDCENLMDYTPLARNKRLTSIIISNCHNEADLSGIDEARITYL